MVPGIKKTRERSPDKVAQLAARARAARERTRAAKEQARLAKRQAHEARKLFKEAKKVAKRAKNELHELSVKLKRLLGGAASKITDEIASRTGKAPARAAKVRKPVARTVTGTRANKKVARVAPKKSAAPVRKKSVPAVLSAKKKAVRRPRRQVAVVAPSTDMAVSTRTDAATGAES